MTEWEVVWRYPAGPDDGSAPACDLEDVDVHVTVTTLFPRWSPPVGALPADVAEWNRYVLARFPTDGTAAGQGDTTTP